MNKIILFSPLLILVIGISYLSTLPPIKQYLADYAQKSMETEFGSAPLSPVHEAKVQTLANEMGITEPIIIRKMNSQAMRIFGYYNAIAASHDFMGILPLVDTPFLFISEGFFEDLSEQEQRFLIGHELTHIKERHTKYIQLLFVLSILLTGLVWWLYVRRRIELMISAYIPQSYQTIGAFGVGFLSVCMMMAVPDLMHLWYRRHIEWDADHQSLALLQAHDGGVQLMERWMKEYKLPAINSYWGLLADHPSCYERRAYCLAHKHSITREVL